MHPDQCFRYNLSIGKGKVYDLQEIRTYYDLADALRERRMRMGIPQLSVDQIAGFQDGYCGKLERPQSSFGRHARWPMLEWWMETLGVVLVPIQRAGSGGKRKPRADCRQYELPF